MQPVLNAFFDGVKLRHIKCSGGTVSSIVKNAEELNDILHVIFNEVLKCVVDHPLFVKKIADF